MPEGSVTAAFGRQSYVTGDDGTQLVCVMRGKRSDAVVGDRVRYAATGGGGGVIDDVLPRRTVLQRADRRRTKLFAANLSRIAVVLAPEPAPSEELLMRALVAAHEANLPAAIVLNKADLLLTGDAHADVALPNPAAQPADAARPLDAARPADIDAGLLERRREVARRVAVYETLGAAVFRIAVKRDPQSACDTLAPWLRGQSTLLLGQSGMGKSTLINALVPDAAMATQAISEALGTGRHTTTFARAFALPCGGTIVDSPGFQEFGLGHLSLSQVQAAMPDLSACAGRCRFNNCTHRNEPGCAVRAAVDACRMDARRYALYVRVADELTRPAY